MPQNVCHAVEKNQTLDKIKRMGSYSQVSHTWLIKLVQNQNESKNPIVWPRCSNIFLVVFTSSGFRFVANALSNLITIDAKREYHALTQVTKHLVFQLYRTHPDGVKCKKLKINDKYINKWHLGVHIKYVGGGRKVLQIFQKIFCSQEDQRTKYFKTQ